MIPCQTATTAVRIWASCQSLQAIVSDSWEQVNDLYAVNTSIRRITPMMRRGIMNMIMAAVCILPDNTLAQM